MLVLNIPAGQTVRVGEIEIKILSSGKKSVDLGFSGDRSVKIVRENAKNTEKHTEEEIQ